MARRYRRTPRYSAPNPVAATYRVPVDVIPSAADYQPLDGAHYASIAEYLSASVKQCRNPANQSHANRHTHNSGHSIFYGEGCDSGAEVRKILREGWPKGRERVDALRGKIAAVNFAPQDRRRKLVRRPMGDMLDIHAVYSGRLDIAWRVAQRQTTHGPEQITLLVDLNVSGMESSDILFWRGASAIALCDMLEASGYRVSIVVGCDSETCGSYEKVACRIVTKAHDMPLDVTSTSATILPGFFRSLFLSWVSVHASKPINSGIGIAGVKIKANEGDTVIPASVRDEASAIDWINSTIAAIQSNQLAA